MVQFVYNISIYEIIKKILFFINHKFYPIIHKILIIKPNNPYIIIKVEHLKFLYDSLKNELLFVKNRMAKYYNIKKIKGSFFEEEGKIYLLCKNIIIKRSNDKLDFKKLKPFIIIRKILKNNYKLLLLKIILIHLIFYIFLFEPILKSTEI